MSLSASCGLLMFSTSHPEWPLSHSFLFRPLGSPHSSLPQAHVISDSLASIFAEKAGASRQVLLLLFTSSLAATPSVPLSSASLPGARTSPAPIKGLDPAHGTSPSQHAALPCSSIIPVSMRPIRQRFLSEKKNSLSSTTSLAPTSSLFSLLSKLVERAACGCWSYWAW